MENQVRNWIALHHASQIVEQRKTHTHTQSLKVSVRTASRNKAVSLWLKILGRNNKITWQRHVPRPRGRASLGENWRGELSLCSHQQRILSYHLPPLLELFLVCEWQEKNWLKLVGKEMGEGNSVKDFRLRSTFSIHKGSDQIHGGICPNLP